MRICDVEGCGRKHVAKGYCAFHYYRWKRWGNPLHESEQPVTFDVADPMGAVAVADRVGITYRQMDYWLRTGAVSIESDSSGSGSRRVFLPNEVAALAQTVEALSYARMIEDAVRSGEFYHAALEELCRDDVVIDDIIV